MIYEYSEQDKKMYDAIKQNDLDTIESLIKKGYDVNNQNFYCNTPLISALYPQKYEIVELFLKNGADPNLCSYDKFSNFPDTFPLSLASDRCDFRIIKLLVEYGADVNIQNIACGDTPLQHVVIRGLIRPIKYLISKGARINGAGNEARTALMETAFCSQNTEKIIKILVEHGAGINYRDTDGNTALMYACQTCNIRAIKTLIELGADVNIGGNVDAMKMLKDMEHEEFSFSELFHKRLSLLAEKYGHYGFGRCRDITPFMVAMSKKRYGKQIAEVLIKNGADVNAEDSLGFTGFDEAKANNNLKTLKYIENLINKKHS